MNNTHTLRVNASAVADYRGKMTQAPMKKSSATVPFSLLPFLLGLIFSQKLNVGGELYIGEIVAFAYIVVNFGKLRLLKVERRLLGFTFAWFMAQLISDLINQTELLDALKGTLAPLVYGGTILFLINYFKNNFARLPAFLMGAAIGEVIGLQISPTEYFLFNSWKWGVGGAVLSVFVIWFSFYLKKKSILLLFAALAVFGAVSLRFDARSMAAFPLIAAFLYALFGHGRKFRFMRHFVGKWGVARLLGILLPVLLLIKSGASALFSSNFILSRVSADTAEKYSGQAEGAYGILLGGRSEILISTRAFIDKPLFGHGSWAKDKNGYLLNFEAERNRLGYSTIPDDTELDSNSLITAHSCLMGALVWAGIFGGLFWLFILHSTTKQFLAHIHQLPFYFYLGVISLTWNILFSPFGATLRWSSALFLAAFWVYGYAKCSQSGRVA